jgi:DNA repair protein RadC
MVPSWTSVYHLISSGLKRQVQRGHNNEVYKLVKRYAGEKRELFILLTLNGANTVISISIVSIGIANRTIVHPREIYIRAITDNAAAIIVCHNHPSGNIIPSDEDKDITKRICKAGEIIGIPLLDHVIFSKADYISLKQEGFIPKTCGFDKSFSA